MDRLTSPENEANFSEENGDSALDGIAIIGLSCRVPGADSVEQFWQNLCNGIESISRFSKEELAADGVPAAQLEQSDYVRAAGYVPNIDQFAAGFFGLSPREAQLMNPQQRLFLECAWQVIEQAGYYLGSEHYSGRVGVYAGAGMNSYLYRNLATNPALMQSVDGYQLFTGNDKDFLPTRTSYLLDLKGPSVNVNSACSSSLVAVHLACQALLSYQTDMALAGGVTLNVPEKEGYLYQAGGIRSIDGHCRAFDASATGTVSGSGLGVVLLKRLSEALADNDTIYAVIRGSAINNDGANKVGFTAPSIAGQMEVIAEAQALAEVSPDSIGYIEAHGTGTALGDPIEISALTQAFDLGAESPLAHQFCAIGSVKTNIGHLDTAAGVVGLIKTALTLYHRQIPPSLHYEAPNPQIDFSQSPFYVNTNCQSWSEDDRWPRRAGVSSFGIGGTNAHVVLEEAPERSVLASNIANNLESNFENKNDSSALVVLSAQTATALEQMKTNLAKFVSTDEAKQFRAADVAYTLAQGRKPFNHRQFWVTEVNSDVRQRNTAPFLSTFDQAYAQGNAVCDSSSGPLEVVFLMPGQGAQHLAMGAGYYQQFSQVRELIDYSAERLKPQLGVDIRQFILLSSEDQDLSQQLTETQYAQPLLFVVSYAISRFWLEQGIQPKRLLGHSLGEYVAACLAGVFSLDDALEIVVQRGRMTQMMQPGIMLAVMMDQESAQQWVSDYQQLAIAQQETAAASLGIAAVNGANQCVLAGSVDAINGFEAFLQQQAPELASLSRRLNTSHAFHSALLDPMLAAFRELIASKGLSPPNLPVVSNVTGEVMTAEQSCSPDYWVDHLRQPVQFHSGLSTIYRDLSRPCFIEMGPGSTLLSLAKHYLKDHQLSRASSFIATLPRQSSNVDSMVWRDSEYKQYLAVVGELWSIGIGEPLQQLFASQKGRRVPLPTYPFERERYWVEPGPLGQLDHHALARLIEPTPQPKRVRSDEDLQTSFHFSLPQWRRLPPVLTTPVLANSENLADEPENITLLFGEPVIDAGLIRYWSEIVSNMGGQWIQVQAHAETRQLSELRWQIQPESPEGYQQLCSHLADQERLPKRIIYAWPLRNSVRLTEEELQLAQNQGFSGLIWLAQALEKTGFKGEIIVLTQQIFDVVGTEWAQPQWSSLLGAVSVIPQEYPSLRCRLIDMDLNDRSLSLLCGELLSTDDASQHPVIALRGGHRWLPSLQALETSLVPNSTTERESMLRPHGTYFITGGLGGIGIQLADYLVNHWQANVVLVGRHLPTEVEHPVEAPLLDVDAIKADLEKAVLDQPITKLDSIPGLLTAMNRYCGLEIFACLHTANLTDHQELITESLLMEKLGGGEIYRPLIQLILRTLLEDGYLKEDDITELGYRWTIKANELTQNGRLETEIQYTKQQAVGVCPGIESMLSLVGHAVSHYLEVLAGELSGVEVLYPQGQSQLLQTTSENTIEHEGAQACYQSIKEFVLRQCKSFSSGSSGQEKVFRILEVGGGKGILTGLLAPDLHALHHDQVIEYHFTDIGKSFVQDLQRQAQEKGYDFMKFGVFDITQSAESQGYAEGYFDVVIGLDVVHATADIAQSLQNLCRLLNRTGVLALSESCRSVRWKEMIWGVTPDWWAFADVQRQATGSPLLTPSQWRGCLAQQDFAFTSVITSGDEDQAYSCVILVKPSSDDDHAVRARLLQNQSQVLVCQADVCDAVALKRAVEAAHHRFGSIQGVIHAAGVEDRQTIASYQRIDDMEGLKPKIYGTYQLTHIFEDEPLDFMVLCSSLSSLQGGIGDSVYVAANSFMDHFAQSAQLPYPCLSINWDRWQGVGQAIPFERRHQQRTGNALSGGLTSKAAIEGFSMAMQSAIVKNIPQLVITNMDIVTPAQDQEGTTWEAPVDNNLTDGPLTDKEWMTSGLSHSPLQHQRPKLGNEYVAATGDTEMAVARIWQDLLGIEQIGVDDNYNALGGDSLLAIRIVSQLREHFKLALDVKDIFEHPTVASLADHLDTLCWALEGAANSEDQLDSSELSDKDLLEEEGLL